MNEGTPGPLSIFKLTDGTLLCGSGKAVKGRYLFERVIAITQTTRSAFDLAQDGPYYTDQPGVWVLDNCQIHLSRRLFVNPSQIVFCLPALGAWDVAFRNLDILDAVEDETDSGSAAVSG